MKQTREILDCYTNKYPEFSYYYSNIEDIEAMENSNSPDKCIESCKALLEGVSKTVLDKLDKRLTRREINEKDFRSLYQCAILKLDSEYKKTTVEESIFEVDICNQFAKQIEKINILRNARCEISHGRAVPKEISSSKKLARTIKGITDHIIAYILEHLFFLLDVLSKNEILKYDSDEYKEFNTYLDAQFENFPVKKVSYSRVLYDYESDTYIVKYKDYTSLTMVEDDSTTSQLNEYNSFNYWTAAKLAIMNDFCTQLNLDAKIIINMIDKYLGESNKINNDDLYNAMFVPPNSDTREAVISSLQKDFEQLIDVLKQTKE